MSEMEYAEWRRFKDAPERAKTAYRQSGQAMADHFAHMGKMVCLGSSAQRKVKDYRLSRYACYLIGWR